MPRTNLRKFLALIAAQGKRVLACVLLVSRALPSAPAQEQTQTPEGTLTSIQEFWNLSADERRKPRPYAIDADVTFYDPAWKLLWIEDQTAAAYAPTGDAKLPVKAGQRVRFTGVSISPGGDLNFDHAAITVIGAARAQPQSIGERFVPAESLANRLLAIEGVVDRQEPNDATHLRLFLAIDGQAAFAWLLLDPAQPPPELTNAVIRFNGIFCPTRTPDGGFSGLEFKIPSLADIQVLHWLNDDPRFSLPLTRIEALATRPAGDRVRVAGTVQSQESGRLLRIRDDTGQVDILTGQSRPCTIDERVEAIGYPSGEGIEVRLREGVYRPEVGAPAAPTAIAAEEVPLRLAREVHELPADEAARGHLVRLTGVVTWSDPGADFLFLQDASGGICVKRGHDPSALRPPGRHIEVQGRTAMGDFAPVVVSSEMIKLGDYVMPRAEAASLEHLQTGAEEAQWVEMRGYLRRVTPGGPWLRLDLVTAGGDFVALLPPTAEFNASVGSILRLHGVCNAETNERRQITGVRLWVPGVDFVQVEEAAPKDPFELPARPLASLGQFGLVESFYRRVKVVGVVLEQTPGHSLYLQQGRDTLLVLSRDSRPLAPGAEIEVVGLLGRQSGRLVLREAMVRQTGLAPEPEPMVLARAQLPTGDLDGHLVRAEGVLLDRTVVRSEVRFVLQADNGLIEATLDDPAATATAGAWPLESRLALTGVYEVRLDEYGQAVASHLQLRSLRDVAVLLRPSWFTRERVLAMAGVLVVGISLVLAWVASLRRRVQRQTAQILRQLAREKRLEEELQQASKLESLGLLAGGIAHDFNNLLTAVMGNLSLARMGPPIDAETRQHLGEAEKATLRARDLTQQLLTFARGGAPVRSAVMLPDVVREVAQFTLRGANVRCEFDFDPGLWPADVDRGQISQVVQNIVLNSVQAMPGGGVIRIRLRNEEVGNEAGGLLAPGRYLRLTIADNGPGIPAEHLPRVFDPYFTTKQHGHGIGLATVFSIVRKHRGHVSVESEVGKGATFHILLPAAGERAPSAHPFTQSRLPELTGSVLIMDDEESIRRLAASMCQRLRLKATVVADGAEAVAEYTRARQAGTPYDLVILDLTVPGGIGGQQAMQELRRVDPGVRAVVSSGYANEQVLADPEAYGFSGVVAKPYELSALARVLGSLLPARAG